MTAGHDARAFECPFFAARNTGADEPQTRSSQFGIATVGVPEIRVAAVDDDVTSGQQRLELFDHAIHRGTGFHHDHDPARGLQAAHEGFKRVITLDPISRPCMNLVGRFVLQSPDEFVGGSGRAIEDRDRKSVVGHVQNEILTHDGQADQTDIML